MEIFIITAPLAAGAWLIIMSLLVSCDNIPSKMVFNIIPFFLGCSALLAGLKVWGVV